MRDQRRPQIFLSFTLLIAVAWIVNHSGAAHASTSGPAAVAATGQTEPPTGGQPANPDSASGDFFPGPADNPPSAKADSSAAAPDSVATAPPDSTTGTPADSAATSTKYKQSNSALPDTLQFLPPPGSTTGSGTKAGGGTESKPAAPKERVGFLGVHPIAILFGLAVLHYFIIKAVSD